MNNMTLENGIQIKALVNAPIEKVWEAWNTPDDIMQWNSADPSWQCPNSENDLRTGGRFKHRMEAKDGSFGFDFEGVYDNVEHHKKIAYTMGDGRKAVTSFTSQGAETLIETSFEPETTNSLEMQQQGWQAILNNFVNYVSSKNKV